jgi:hypothetical protein
MAGKLGKANFPERGKILQPHDIKENKYGAMIMRSRTERKRTG